ncbi:hypothetical protein M413DRAFT_259632 [Hebeloma cylindrosporum]|uniref:Uncharacterized protein n=1 Tax=Hebeloma cylindrosporum TaxID=76867 RepID=A0A0C2Y9Z3_HEBCY|nr:hypothetical protein M413DRAFT_259632 [Hebeloma cylindrosporum h7]
MRVPLWTCSSLAASMFAFPPRSMPPRILRLHQLLVCALKMFAPPRYIHTNPAAFTRSPRTIHASVRRLRVAVYVMCKERGKRQCTEVGMMRVRPVVALVTVVGSSGAISSGW